MYGNGIHKQETKECIMERMALHFLCPNIGLLYSLTYSNQHLIPVINKIPYRFYCFTNLLSHHSKLVFNSSYKLGPPAFRKKGTSIIPLQSSNQQYRLLFRQFIIHQKGLQTSCLPLLKYQIDLTTQLQRLTSVLMFQTHGNLMFKQIPKVLPFLFSVNSLLQFQLSIGQNFPCTADAHFGPGPGPSFISKHKFLFQLSTNLIATSIQDFNIPLDKATD